VLHRISAANIAGSGSRRVLIAMNAGCFCRVCLKCAHVRETLSRRCSGVSALQIKLPGAVLLHEDVIITNLRGADQTCMGFMCPLAHQRAWRTGDASRPYCLHAGVQTCVIITCFFSGDWQGSDRATSADTLLPRPNFYVLPPDRCQCSA
jgi:hypothetical protein